MYHPERYSRNQKAITEREQSLLAAATVAIVGCGGLGGYIAEEYARLGVGNLVLIDGDRFEVTNLNRQLMSTEQNLGEWKAVAARERIQTVNSLTRVSVYTETFEAGEGEKMLRGANLVCDALDTLSYRLKLEQACHDLGLPLVFTSIGGWYGMTGVSLPGDRSVQMLYGNGQGERGVEDTLGNPVFTPAVLASISVAEGVKVLTGRPLSLRHAWLYVDLLSMEFQRFELLA